MFSAIHVLGFVGSSAFAQVVWQNQFIEFASVPEVWAGKVRDVADFCDVANMPEMKKHLDTFIPFPIFGAPLLWGAFLHCGSRFLFAENIVLFVLSQGTQGQWLRRFGVFLKMDFFSADLQETFDVTCPHLKNVTMKLREAMAGVSWRVYPAMEFLVAAMCFLREDDNTNNNIVDVAELLAETAKHVPTEPQVWSLLFDMHTAFYDDRVSYAKRNNARELLAKRHLESSIEPTMGKRYKRLARRLRSFRSSPARVIEIGDRAFVLSPNVSGSDSYQFPLRPSISSRFKS